MVCPEGPQVCLSCRAAGLWARGVLPKSNTTKCLEMQLMSSVSVFCATAVVDPVGACLGASGGSRSNMAAWGSCTDPWLEACAQTRVKRAQVCAVLGGKCA